MSNVPLPARSRTQRGYAELLLQHSRGGGAFLEIGADIGLFADWCAKLGRFEHFWLYEPNEQVHAELRERFRGRPHTIRSEMRPTPDLQRGSCSTGALIHVLDHLLDPLGFLGSIGDALEADGVLLLVTHNTDSMLARLLGKRFPPFALQHPQLYSPASLRRLLERAGYSIVSITGSVNHFPVMHLIRAGFSVLGMSNVAPGLQGPTIPIKLGNMAVVARKRR